MNSNSSSPPPTSQGQPKALPASMIRGADDRLGVFDIAETIQRLCNEGTIDMGASGPNTNPVPPGSGIDRPGVAHLEDATAPSALGALPPTLSILAPNFLQCIVNQLSKSTERAIGVAIVSKSGRVTHSADCGWTGGFSLASKTLLNRITRECVLQPVPRLSIEAMNLVPQASEACGDVRGSVCLNELSQFLGTPLFMFPIALEQSLGFAVFFCDASPCKEVGTSAFCDSARKLWLEASFFENLVQQLDSWLVVHRCSLS